MNQKKKLCPTCEGSCETEIRAFAAGSSPYDKRIVCPKCCGEGWLVRLEDKWFPDRVPLNHGAPG